MLDKSLLRQMLIEILSCPSGQIQHICETKTDDSFLEWKLTFCAYTRGCIEYSANTTFTSLCCGELSASQGGGSAR